MTFASVRKARPLLGLCLLWSLAACGNLEDPDDVTAEQQDVSSGCTVSGHIQYGSTTASIYGEGYVECGTNHQIAVDLMISRDGVNVKSAQKRCDSVKVCTAGATITRTGTSHKYCANVMGGTPYMDGVEHHFCKVL